MSHSVRSERTTSGRADASSSYRVSLKIVIGNVSIQPELERGNPLHRPGNRRCRSGHCLPRLSTCLEILGSRRADVELVRRVVQGMRDGTGSGELLEVRIDRIDLDGATE